MPHFDGDRQHLVEAVEDRDLDQHGQAARQRIDLFLLIERHQLLLLLGRVVLEALAQLFDLRLHLLHLGERLVALVGQREEDELHSDGQQQDGDAEVADVAEDEVEEGEHRPGDEPEVPPVDGHVEVRHAQLGLVVLQHRNRLGAGEQAGGLGDLAAGGDDPRLADIVGFVDVGRTGLGHPVLALDALFLIRDHGGEPVLVGDAGPAAGGGDRRAAAVLQPLGVLHLAQFVAEPADRAFMDDLYLAQAGRDALALDRAVGSERHRSRAGVGHGVGHREHEAVVHLDLAGKGQALAGAGAQRQRLAGREGRTLDQLPDGVCGRQAGQVGAGPAELGEVGVARALRAQQLHRRRGLVDRLAVVLQEQVVDPRAAQGDRTAQGRSRDRRPGAGCGGLLTRDHHGSRRRAGEHAGLLGLHGRSLLADHVGVPPLGGGVHDQELVGDQDQNRADHEDDRIAVVVLLHKDARSGGGGRRGARRSAGRAVAIGREAYQRAFHIVKQTRPWARRRAVASDQYIVEAGLGELRQKHPGGFTHAPLGAIADHRPPDLTGGGEADSDQGGVVGPISGLQYDRAFGARNSARRGEKIRALLQALDF